MAIKTLQTSTFSVAGKKKKLLITDSTNINTQINNPEQSISVETNTTVNELQTEVRSVTDTSKGIVEQDADYYTVDLPSGGAFNSVSSLQVRNLFVKDISKTYRAYTEQKTRYLVEAMSATLGNCSAFNLTSQDFYYLLYWHRLSSYTKNKHIIEFSCSNPEHIVKVTKKLLPESSLLNSQFLTSTTLQVNNYEKPDLSEYFKEFSNYTLCVETMQDVVDLEDYFAGRGDNNRVTADEEFIYTVAPFINNKENNLGIEKRLELVERLSPDQLSVLKSYIKQVTSYGVLEYAKLRCKECGGSVQKKIVLDPLSFLP